MSRENQAIITVRYYVGEDRERSLVKLYKKLDENLDIVPPGVTGWVVKPVEIDDVPVVTLTLASARLGRHALCAAWPRKSTQRLAGVQDVSRAYVVGGRPRVVQVLMDPDRMAALSRLAAGIAAGHPGGQRAPDGRRFPQQGPADPRRGRRALRQRPAIARSGRRRVRRPARLPQGRRPGRGRAGGSHQLRAPRLGAGPRVSPSTSSSPARFWAKRQHDPVCPKQMRPVLTSTPEAAWHPSPAVTIAIAKKKGSNAVWVANAVLRRGRRAARDDRARQHGTGRHPELRPDGQREGQRTGRGPGRGHPHRRGPA